MDQTYLLASDFDYDLPPGLIAQHPPARRDDSRMMVVSRADGRILHRRFREFPEFLNPGDVLVLNDTKVIPAKTWGKRGEATIEFLFVKELRPGVWDLLCKPAKRLRPGDDIVFGGTLRAKVISAGEEGRRTLEFSALDVLGHLRTIGYAPLPPYIKRGKADAKDRPSDLERYQTIFAEKTGAIAAPTAGLHFTRDVLRTIEDKGVRLAQVTLEVGLATFQPMRTELLEDHKMLEESYTVSAAAASAINAAKKDRRPVVAVGTTVVRTLESAARPHSGKTAMQHASGRSCSSFFRESQGGPQGGLENRPPFLKGGEGGLRLSTDSLKYYEIRAGTGTTSLFIYPGYEFKVVDRLLTNFHLPKSTLLMLVAAFSGRDLVLAAYREAVRKKYRFFSYGDCMLIL